MTPSFIDDLRKAADQAAAAETQYRREAARRIADLESERAFAFRRLGLMRALADDVGRADSEDAAVVRGLDILCERLDRPNDSEADSALLARFAPVVAALFASLKPADGTPGGDVGALLDEFETWYVETHRRAFWTLFDQPMAETPRVDF